MDEEKQNSFSSGEFAGTDPLTGVLDISTFAAECDQLLSESREGTQHVLLILDIDGFRLLNNTFGPAAGDQALVDVANSLRSVLRYGDLLGRFTGDKFIACLKDIPYYAVINKKAKQLCALVRKSFNIEVQISASIGIAVCPRDGRDFETLSRNAETALHHIKKVGKDDFLFYSSKMDAPDLQPETEFVNESVFEPKTKESKRRMLIVDDSEISRKLLTNIFRDDFIVETASDGRTALLRLRHYGAAISVVLLDLVMPGLDGLAVLEQMRADPDMRTIPVVVVSVADDRGNSLKCIKCGASDFVNKPIDPDLVRLRVQSAVSKAENERLRAQNSYLMLQSSEEAKYRTVLDATGTVMIEYDWINAVFLYDPSISARIAGTYDGRKLWRIMLSDMVADSADVKAMQQLVQSVAENRQRLDGSMIVKLRTPSREKHWFRLNVYKRTDEFQLTDKLMLTFNDINEEMQADEKLRFQVEHDDLTGMYNRASFLKKAEETVRENPANSYFMSVCDIDNFKTVNERFGHAEGDKLLQYTAERLTADAEIVHGICGRLDNDLFAMLLPHNFTSVEKMNYYPRGLLSHYPLDLELTCSQGHYLIDDPDMSADRMLDRAMAAKQTIKGHYDIKMAWYSEDMRRSRAFVREVSSSMESALANGEFQVFFQPVWDQTTGKLLGAEALSRWVRSDGVMLPEKYIPIFENTGFMMRFDKFVWEQTCQALRKWIDEGRAVVPVSVNVSRLLIFNPKLRDTLKCLVRKYQLPVEMFRVEIPESAYLEDPKQLAQITEGLRRDGFGVIMDDFGSGCASLNMLNEIKLESVKLDMRFMDESEDKKRCGTILGAVVHIADELGVRCMAEGVETQEQADFLKEVGCKVIQGDVKAKAMPAAEFEKLLG